MNRKNFHDSLNNNRDISEIEIIYFSQNTDNLFENFKINNKKLREKSISVLEILGKYLPCSLPIIEEYLKEFYGYPKDLKNPSQLIILYSDLLNRGLKNYEFILKNIGCDFQNNILYKKYTENINSYEEQKKNFQEILSFEKEENDLKREIERLSSENRILENEEVGDLEKISSMLKHILKLDEESKNIIKSLEARGKND